MLLLLLVLALVLVLVLVLVLLLLLLPLLELLLQPPRAGQGTVGQKVAVLPCGGGPDDLAETGHWTPTFG